MRQPDLWAIDLSDTFHTVTDYHDLTASSVLTVRKGLEPDVALAAPAAGAVCCD